MRISDFDLLRWATAFIEDGKLKKWRYDNNDPTHIDRLLNLKVYSQEPLTEKEINYIKTFDHVIVADKHSVRFHRFSGVAVKYNEPKLEKER